MQSREFSRAESVYATVVAADTSVDFTYSNIVTASEGARKD
jgi:hypothetical protein